MCQTGHFGPSLKDKSVQTPSGEPLYLPAGWSVRRIVDRAATDPLCSPREMGSRFRGSKKRHYRRYNLIFLQLFFEAHAETTHLLLDRLDTYQRQLRVLVEQGQSTCEAQRAFEVWVGQLRNRAHGFYGSSWATPTAAASTAGNNVVKMTLSSINNNNNKNEYDYRDINPTDFEGTLHTVWILNM
jgi:hypothetical protein